MSKKWKKPGSVSIRAAAAPVDVCLQAGGDPAELVFEALAAGDEKKLPTFAMVAYNGGPMHPGGWYESDPIIVDLAGLAVDNQSVPIDAGHASDIGHSTKIDKAVKQLKASGVLSGFSDSDQDESAIAARRIVRMGKQGFPFQASIQATAKREKIDYIRAGETVRVNGRSFDGPVYVARQSSLKKIAILSLGADETTSTTVAASIQKGIDMDPIFVAWLKANELPESPTGKALSKLEAQWKAETTTPTPTPVIAAAVPVVPEFDMQAALKKQREEFAIEAQRVAGIRRICAAHPGMEAEIEVNGVKSKVSIEAHAIAEGWTVKDTSREVELAVLRAGRPQSPSPHFYVPAGQPNPTNEVLEAAFCQTRRLPGIEKQFKPDVLEAANKFYRDIGLQQLFLTAAAANGYHVRPGERVTNGNFRDILRAAFEVRASGVSSISLPGILGNVANKEIVAGYMQEDQTWREIAKVVSHSNFHSHTVYRMLDNMEYEELGAGGEIKHGTTEQESYTSQVKTYAKMYALSRTSIVNDDLQALDSLRERIGRGGSQKFNKVFWTEFMSDASTFWTSTRTNYITGATTTLLVDGVGLGLGVKGFRQMTTPAADGAKRVGGQPKILLVPPELETASRVLFTERGGVNIATAGNANPWSNMFRPVVAWQLSDSNYTGYSTTAWFLLRDPTDMATIRVSFLNGMEMPTVETADADFNQLGVQFRGYHDFGCDQAEYLAGLKSKGAA